MEAVQNVENKKINANEIQGINKQTFAQRLSGYKRQPLSLFLLIVVCLSALLTVGVLLFLIGYILVNGIPNIKPELFEWEYNTDNVSMLPSMINTLYMTGLTLLMAVPVGVFSAIYMVEYAKRGSKLVKIVRTTTETLQGIPSIVYGLFGYLMFVIGCHWGYTLMAGAITLAIMVLPVIMQLWLQSRVVSVLPVLMPARQLHRLSVLRVCLVQIRLQSVFRLMKILILLSTAQLQLLKTVRLSIMKE